MSAQTQRQSSWGPLPMESAQDWFDRRAAQAAALAKLTYGETGAEFRGFNGEIQDRVMWLLGDLLEELRDAHALALQEREQWALRKADKPI